MMSAITPIETGDACVRYPARLVRLDDLRPTEAHYRELARALAARIERARVWTTPLWVEENVLLVMDGHHRLAAARRLGLVHLPCVVLGYDNPRLELSTWDPERKICADDIVNAALSGKLLPQKTTRHRLTPAPRPVAIPLSALR
jgi:L-serine kinase (ADP)